MTQGILTLRGHSAPADAAYAARGQSAFAEVEITIQESLPSVEALWRAFEPDAECTAFQTYDWLATWQQHIGALQGIRPVIVIGRDSEGILFLLPLCIRTGPFARQLEWLGTELCDYNAPILAKDFSDRIEASKFPALAQSVLRSVQSNPTTRHDIVLLEKMPARIGAQPNFMLGLGTAPNPSGAHCVELPGDWEAFYHGKRSSTTRRRDRTKRSKLSEIGEVSFINAETAADRTATLDTLIEQKQRTLAAMGAANMFARPGHRAFFHALADGEATKSLVHISRIRVGSVTAAANLGLTFRGRYYYLLSSYGGGEASRYGPGALHLRELMRQAIERSFTCFDFTIGDEAYKSDWCDIHVDLFDHLSATSALGMVVVARNAAIRRIKRWIKQTPLVWKIFTTARSYLGSMRAR